jgi:tellurite resistance protein
LHKGCEKKNEVGTRDAASETIDSCTENEGNKLVIGAAVSEATADGTEDATEGKRLATEAM